MKIGIIDYGVGNLGSVARALETLQVSPQLVSQPAGLAVFDKLILPGVGNFGDCAELLARGDWVAALGDVVMGGGKPLLGVCAGMQLLATRSAEGAESAEGKQPPRGLNFVPGRVEHLRTLGCELRIPHVGWNAVQSVTNEGGLFCNIPDGTDFYFAHSYAFVPDAPENVIAVVDYGIPVTAAVRCGNVWGTQFHPEKSAKAGFRLLRNFIDGSQC